MARLIVADIEFSFPEEISLDECLAVIKGYMTDAFGFCPINTGKAVKFTPSQAPSGPNQNKQTS